MQLIYRIFAAFLATTIAAEADELDKLPFDKVEGLVGVQAIAFDTETDSFFATLEDRSLHFELFPLRLKGEVGHEFRAKSNGVGPNGNLFVVGEEERDQKGRLFPFGKVEAFAGVRDKGLTVASTGFPLEIAPLTAISFDRDENVYLQSASHHSVISYSTDTLLNYEGGGFSSKVVTLACGPTMKFSVLEEAGAQHFISSVNSKDMLELGKIPSKGDGSCIDGDRLVSSKSRSITKVSASFSVKDHSLIQGSAVQNGTTDGNGILIFDPTTSQLTFFPIAEYGGAITLRRSAQVTADLSRNFGQNTSQFGLLASDATGNSILLSGFDERQVHRLSWDGSEFEYMGRFDMGASVKNLYISQDGEFAAIVTGAPNGQIRENPENEITLVRLPSEIPNDTPLGMERYSVAKLQQELRNSGDKDVVVDGILGPQTLASIERYRKETEPMRSVSSNNLEKDAFIKGILPNWPTEVGAN